MDRAQVDLDLRMKCVKPRQRRQQHVVSQLGMSGDRQQAAGALARAFEAALDLSQLVVLQLQRAAAIQIFGASGRWPYAMRVAFEQDDAKLVFKRSDQLLHGRNADLQTLRGAREAARLDRTDEIFERLELVHESASPGRLVGPFCASTKR